MGIASLCIAASPVMAAAGLMTTPTAASSTQTIQPGGGTLTIPAFGGFSGSIRYTPNNSTGASVTLTSSTTPLAGEPNGGTATKLYLNAVLHVPSGNLTYGAGYFTLEVASPALSPTTTYSAWFFTGGAPGRSVNLGSPRNGMLVLNVPTKGYTVPNGARVVFELRQN